jgi:multiple sugar transport system permease protein
MTVSDQAKVQRLPIAPGSGGDRHVVSRPSRMRSSAAPYILVAPFALLFVFLFLVPIVYAIAQSFGGVKRVGLLGQAQTTFVGLANYQGVFHDPAFWHGFLRVLEYGAVTIPIEIGFALVLALLVDSAVVRFRHAYRLAFFLPYAVPVVVATLMWSSLYEPDFSPLTITLHWLGLPAPDFLGPGTVLWSMANIALWIWIGYNMIIFYSALRAVPPEIYEAARIDGSSELSIAWRIKIPLIRPAITIAFLFAMIGTLQFFNEPAILSVVSSAIGTDYTPNYYAYNTAFSGRQYGYASAMSIVLALITTVLSFVVMRWSARRARQAGAR